MRQRGFTLLEVMIALAILSGALVVLLRLATADVTATHRAKMLSIATGLARAKMYDIEEDLLDHGFPEGDSPPTMPNEGDFSEEGQPRFRYSIKVEKVELPSVQQLQEGKEDKPAEEKDVSSELGLTGAAGTGAAMVQMYFPLVQPVLETAIRRVTLTVTWPIGRNQEKMDVICFFTDTKAIDQAAALSGAAGGGTTPPASGGGSKPTQGGTKP